MEVLKKSQVIELNKADVRAYSRKSRKGLIHTVRDHKRVDPSKRVSLKLMQVLGGMKYRQKKDLHDKIMGQIKEVKEKVLKGEGSMADVFGVVKLATDLEKARVQVKPYSRKGRPVKGYSATRKMAEPKGVGESKTKYGIKYDPKKMEAFIAKDAFLQFVAKRGMKPEVMFNTYIVGDSAMENAYQMADMKSFDFRKFAEKIGGKVGEGQAGYRTKKQWKIPAVFDEASAKDYVKRVADLMEQKGLHPYIGKGYSDSELGGLNEEASNTLNWHISDPNYRGRYNIESLAKPGTVELGVAVWGEKAGVVGGNNSSTDKFADKLTQIFKEAGMPVKEVRLEGYDTGFGTWNVDFAVVLKRK